MPRLRLERPALDAALLSFAGSGHGLILGRAGVGKSFSLSRLAQTLRSTQKAHLIVGVEDLGGATEDEVRGALGYQEPSFAEAVVHLFATAPRGTVIFDGFDAARSETARTRVLGIVRSTIRRAPEGWTVLVSVRSYDASKSPTLLGLFPRSTSPVQAAYRLSGVVTRHFAIPELTSEEVLEAVRQIEGLPEIYRQSSDAFRRLARVPFNLWLMECVLSSDADKEKMRLLHSEVQLLDLYWSTHVTGVPDGEVRTRILRQATSAMIKSRSLAFTPAEVFSDEIATSWHALFSSNVLSETGPGKQAAQFSHNILFDYAISVLAIPESTPGLVDFLTEDSSRPLFLRPSLLYYFVQLWHSHRQRFWQCLWQLQNSEPLAVKLVSRLLPPYVVAAESRSIDDLEPLIRRSLELDGDGATAVLRVLQALRFAEVQDLVPWVSFAARIAKSPARVFAWELATFLGRILDDPTSLSRPETRELAGQASRDLFDWAWRHRTPELPWYDAFASVLALPLVMKTFATAVDAATSIARKILTNFREPNFPLRYLYNLADGITELASDAPSLVADAYTAIFSHEETSDETTSLGGIVLRLTSNRRQDFEMCRYSLARDFPKFLKRAPATAIAVGFDILNSYAWREHVASSGNTDLRSELQFRGSKRFYVADWSVAWSNGLNYEDEGTIANAIENFLQETDIDPARAVDIAAAHSETAFTWALLLQVGARAPARFADVLFDLAISRPIQMGLDTRHLVASFIEAAAPHWSLEQLDLFQREALALKEPESPEELDNRQEYRTQASDLMLASIPTGLLTVAAARDRVDSLAKAGATPKNEPAVSYSSFSRALTPEIWLEEKGVALASPENAPLFAHAKNLEEFRNAWANKRPTAEAIESIRPEISSTLEMLRGIPHPVATGPRAKIIEADGLGTAPALLVYAWTNLAGTANALARATLSPTNPAFQLVREALMRAAEFPSPELREDRDKEFSTPSWSPTPRTEAIEGLSHLAFQISEDSSVAERFVSFAGSAEPSERYLTVSYLPNLARHWPSLFWAATETRADEEINPTIVTILIRTIWASNAGDKEKGLEILRRLLPRWLKDESSNLQQAIAQSLGRLAFVENDPWAWDQLHKVQNGLPKANELLRDVIVGGIAATFHRDNVEDLRDRNFEKRVIDWTLNLLSDFKRRAKAARDRLEANLEPPTTVPSNETLPSPTEEIASLHSLVEEIVRRVYFATQGDEREDTGEYASPEEPSASRVRECIDVVRPVMRAVLSFAAPDGAGVLVPGAAHDFMQFLNVYVSFDPEDALGMAAETAAVAAGGGYQFDSLAIKEVVRLVEVVLADHRDRISAGKPLADILRLLDVFADAGWPEALRLVWRLDEVFR
jgi:hypothetical protein